MSLTLSATVKGDTELLNKLDALERSIARKMIRKAVRKGVQVGAKLAKPFAPKDSGTMKKSLGSRVARSKGQPKAVGIVGARRRFEIAGKRPTKYMHLVAGGTKAHQVNPKTTSRLAFRVGGRIVVVPGVTHPGTRPNQWLSRAYSASRSSMQSTLINTLRTDLATEAQKPRPGEIDDGA
jgi:HK97 gp10 family phage protein